MQKYEKLLECSVILLVTSIQKKTKRYTTHDLIFKTSDFGDNNYELVITSSALFQIDLFRWFLLLYLFYHKALGVFMWLY